MRVCARLDFLLPIYTYYIYMIFIYECLFLISWISLVCRPSRRACVTVWIYLRRSWPFSLSTSIEINLLSSHLADDVSEYVSRIRIAVSVSVSV